MDTCKKKLFVIINSALLSPRILVEAENRKDALSVYSSYLNKDKKSIKSLIKIGVIDGKKPVTPAILESLETGGVVGLEFEDPIVTKDWIRTVEKVNTDALNNLWLVYDGMRVVRFVYNGEPILII